MSTTEDRLAALNAMNAAELRERLGGSPETTIAFLREAAEAGVAEAQLRLGQALLDGVGVAKDAAAGFGWFVKAAQAGHVEAINMVGRCFDLGWGVPIDRAQAAAWFRAAAERGLDWGMYNYATALALGEGVAEDKAAALAWFRKAARLGHAKAINHIGSFHEDGWATRVDIGQAARCYRRAARGGDFRGMFNHARMLARDGKIGEACEWIARAGEAGHAGFRAQMAEWLAASDVPRLREAGAALPQACD